MKDFTRYALQLEAKLKEVERVKGDLLLGKDADEGKAAHLTTKLATCMELLREVEWEGDQTVIGRCPLCKELGQEHTPTCRLSAILEGV